jgi:hypothetical protein
MFASPAAASSGWTARDAIGHLCIIEPHAHETGIPTSFGDKDAIRATVHDVDAGTTDEDALIFQGGLIGALKARIGQLVLARITQGTAKPGQAAPFVLADASTNPADVAAATAYMQARQASAFTPPQQAAPAAAPVAPSAPAAGVNADAIAAAQALLAQQGMAR